MNLLHQQIDAYAFAPEWGQEMVGGTLVLSVPELRFEYPGGVIVIPMGRLRAEVRPGDDERIVFTDVEDSGLEIFTAEMDLLECQVLPPLNQAREDFLNQLARCDTRRRLRILAYCVAACVILTLVGSALLGLMVRSIAKHVPAEWETKIKEQGMAELGVTKDATADTNLIAEIEALAAPLLAVVPRPANGYKFYVIRDLEPNAAALPGGHIVINEGLLRIVKQPEELLGVLAHEVAHVTERHQYREMISSAGPMMICQIFFARSRGFGRLLGTGAALMIGAGFSQEYETEADDVGWDYLVKANIDPRGMIRTFEKFKELDDEASVHAPQAFNTHPALNKRIKRLEKKWSKLRLKSGFIEPGALPKLPELTEDPLLEKLRKLVRKRENR